MKGRKECDCPLARHTHGTPAGYAVCGCKCLPCRLAYGEQNREWRAGNRTNVERTRPYVDATGTRRRIEALHAVGWSGKEIADRLGVRLQYVHRLRTCLDRIMPTTAARIADLYDELWDKQPPSETRGQRQAATYARSNAKRHGWAMPMSWDDDCIDDPDARPFGVAEQVDGIDEVAVHRAAGGERVKLTRAELTEAIDTLTARGYTADMTAARLGLSARTVQRYQAKAKAA